MKNPGDQAPTPINFGEAKKNFEKSKRVKEGQEKLAAEKRRLEEADFFFDSAVSYDEAGQIDDAIADYKKTIELNPKHAKAMVGLGTLYCNAKRNRIEAQDCFQKATEIDPNYVLAWYNLGTTYYRQKAAECYQRALSLDPMYHDARYNLAVEQARTGDYMEAIKNYQSYIDLALNTEGYNKYKIQAEYAIRRLKRSMVVKSTKKAPPA